MNIYKTNKFHHSEDQYRLDAGGFTLLRMTLGRSGRKLGGKVKTATAGDSRDRPAYPNRSRLIDALDVALQELCGRDVEIVVQPDSRGRLFGEVADAGTPQQFLEMLAQIGERMAINLGLESHQQ